MEISEIINRKFFREISIEITRSAVDEKKRTVEVSFSSEQPVQRWFGNEILDHSAEAVDLSRLNSGAAVMVDHHGDQIGVVERAWIDSGAKKGRALLRFSKSTRGEEIFQDIQDGIRRNTSVGYDISEIQFEGETAGVESYRATKWTPLEISIVGVPADATVGVGRSHSQIITTEKRNSKMPNENENESLNRGERRQISERERIANILAMARKHNQMDLAQDFIANGSSANEFGLAVLERKGEMRPLASIDSPNTGLSDSEISRFSITKCIREIAFGNGLSGLEKEASEATSRKLGRQIESKRFTIPHEIATANRSFSMNTNRLEKLGANVRALLTTTSTAGGYAVDSEVLGGNLIEILRNRMVISQLGAMNLSGLQGNVTIPKQSGAGTANWLSETATLTTADQVFGQVLLTPHRLSAGTPYSKELIAQASLDVEGFVRADLMKVIAIAQDLAAIAGLGANGQPLGILSTTGVGSITFGAAATWAKLIAFETSIAGANADVGNLGFLTTPNVRAKLKAAPKISGYPNFLWENSTMGMNGPDYGNGTRLNPGVVNGYFAYATNQVPGDKVIFGNWNDLILASWAGIDITVDPYSLSLQNQVRVIITILADVAIRHPVSFCISSDSGAQ